MQRFSRWAAGLHLGQLVIITLFTGTAAVFFLAWFGGMTNVVLPCLRSGSPGWGCADIYTFWLPIWVATLLVGIFFGAVSVRAWWSWFGARRVSEPRHGDQAI